MPYQRTTSVPISHGRILLPLGYMAALFLLSSIPGDASTDTLVGKVFQWVTPDWQNLLHIPLYAGLTASWLWATAGYPLDHRYRLGIAFVLTLLWAVVDEAHQMGVPGRYGSLTDLALNLLGAALAITYARHRAKRDA
jgi:VanZ family protein